MMKATTITCSLIVVAPTTNYRSSATVLLTRTTSDGQLLPYIATKCRIYWRISGMV